MKSLNAISDKELAELKKAVAKAEKRTSGEIRVYLEEHSEDGPLDRAAFLFKELGMDKTKLRNGVLIYVALKDRKFSIIGDQGIHEKVGFNFWDGVKKKMVFQFSEGKIVNGLMEAVVDAGEALSKYFPYADDDTNELPDDIIFGKDPS